MINKEIKMDAAIVEILEKDSFDNFNISQFKDAYANICNDKSAVETRKLVYKQVLRLVKHGALIKEGDKNSHNITYRKVDFFSQITFIKKTKVIKLEKANAFTVPNKGISTLEEKLHEYKIDMMTAIGESEEYIKLAQLFPEMKVQLKEEYHLARDKSAKLLGQIKAIKTIIYIQESS